MTTSIYDMFVQMWILDYEMKLEGFGKAYFQGLVKSGQLKTEDYQKIVGEAYVAPTAQTEPSAQVQFAKPLELYQNWPANRKSCCLLHSRPDLLFLSAGTSTSLEQHLL